jgi:hypothetical protein
VAHENNGQVVSHCQRIVDNAIHGHSQIHPFVI